MRRAAIFILLALGLWAAAATAEAATSSAGAALIPLPQGVGFWLGVFSLVVVAAGAITLGIRTDMLRDSQPTDFGGAAPMLKNGKTGTYRRPYSLAQTQMTWWFCIIVASYLYIAFTASSGVKLPNVEGGITTQALILLGIGAGTALGAAMIEQVKSDNVSTLSQFQAVVAQLRATPEPANAADLRTQRDELAPQLASQSFLRDILTDVDGISLHRFQALVWTVVLGGMFISNVLMNDAMPVFSATLLALLGISNGTYLGFKVPEQPA
jgi:hypothetical protein